jgi:hypothetical protein
VAAGTVNPSERSAANFPESEAAGTRPASQPHPAPTRLEYSYKLENYE